jgi:aspartate kinase
VALVVQKYGGTSVGDAHRIKRVAERVVAAARQGKKVCVVVSAMGHSTDELVALASQVTRAPHRREMDMLLTAGERISMALLSMAIIDLGHDAVSFTGSQAGIVTDTTHGKARIVEVKAKRVREALDDDKIAIVAGFQGVSTSFDVTTLGRGGSDTTAVALAAALGADMCEIYTDVDGVYTADPRIVPHARKLHAVSYEEMLELAASGARVLMVRSVEYARNYGVLVHVRSSFGYEEGTWIKQEDERMERAIISGIAHDTSEAKITMRGVPQERGAAARLFRPLANEDINVDMIVQGPPNDGRTDFSFTLPKEDLPRAHSVLEATARSVGATEVDADSDIAKVSLVGAGMKTHPGVAADMFDALSDAGIDIQIVSTSSIRISCVVRASDVERAVRTIHDKFSLPEEVVMREEHPATVSGQLRAVKSDGGTGPAT